MTKVAEIAGTILAFAVWFAYKGGARLVALFRH